MTMWPPTRCSAPAKRSIVASSALRADIFDTGTRLSSSLTAAVIAMRASLHLRASSSAVRYRLG